MGICIKIFSTKCIACSKLAGSYLFGKNLVNKGEVEIINNGINIDTFHKEDIKVKDHLTQELDISDRDYVLGFVGRLVPVKNPLFVLLLLERILESIPEAICIIVGEGPLKSEIEYQARKRNLLKSIRLTGNRNDIPDIMGLFDVFLLPSHFEGLPIVALEAQAKGLPCIISDNVPDSVDLGLDLVQQVSLGDIDGWVNAVSKKIENELDKEKIKNVFNSKGFDSKSSSIKLLKVYGV